MTARNEMTEPVDRPTTTRGDLMKFLFLVCSPMNQSMPTPVGAGSARHGEVGPVGDDVQVWVDQYDNSGNRLAGDRLDGHVETVRVRAGDLLVTDGPFLESKEYIAGFDLIEAASLDEARTIAARHPMAQQTGIEIRPLAE
jgi:hypothetical protein